MRTARHLEIINTLVRPDGSPAAWSEVLVRVDTRIHRASDQGRGLRLSAAEVRALDWAVIRESGGLDCDALWLRSSCSQWAKASPPITTGN